MKHTTKVCSQLLVLAALSLSLLRLFPASTQRAKPDAPNPVTAIDILLDPDTTMIQHALAANSATSGQLTRSSRALSLSPECHFGIEVSDRKKQAKHYLIGVSTAGRTFMKTRSIHSAGSSWTELRKRSCHHSEMCARSSL